MGTKDKVIVRALRGSDDAGYRSGGGWGGGGPINTFCVGGRDDLCFKHPGAIRIVKYYVFD